VFGFARKSLAAQKVGILHKKSNYHGFHRLVIRATARPQLFGGSKTSIEYFKSAEWLDEACRSAHVPGE